jgi:hypothetical protein
MDIDLHANVRFRERFTPIEPAPFRIRNRISRMLTDSDRIGLALLHNADQRFAFLADPIRHFRFQLRLIGNVANAPIPDIFEQRPFDRDRHGRFPRTSFPIGAGRLDTYVSAAGNIR